MRETKNPRYMEYKVSCEKCEGWLSIIFISCSCRIVSEELIEELIDKVKRTLSRNWSDSLINFAFISLMNMCKILIASCPLYMHFSFNLSSYVIQKFLLRISDSKYYVMIILYLFYDANQTFIRQLSFAPSFISLAHC